MIVAAEAPRPALAAKAATATIPIVFTVGDDPVRLGLVASLNRPGGNVTGVSVFSATLAAKRLELLRELVPEADRVAVLVNPPDARSTEATMRDVAGSGAAHRAANRCLNASTEREIDAAFATLCSSEPDALFVGPDPFFIAVGASNLSLWRRATRCPRSIRSASLPKPAA